MKKRNTARRKCKNNDSSAACCSYKRVRNKLRSVLKASYKQYVQGLGEKFKHNPKAFWSFVKHKTGQGSIPYTLYYNNTVLSDSIMKANAFNNYFYSVFNTSNCDIYPKDYCIPLDKSD